MEKQMPSESLNFGKERAQALFSLVYSDKFNSPVRYEDVNFVEDADEILFEGGAFIVEINHNGITEMFYTKELEEQTKEWVDHKYGENSRIDVQTEYSEKNSFLPWDDDCINFDRLIIFNISPETKKDILARVEKIIPANVIRETSQPVVS